MQKYVFKVTEVDSVLTTGEILDLIKRIGGSTSNLLSGQNPATRFDEYDAGHTDLIRIAQEIPLEDLLKALCINYLTTVKILLEPLIGMTCQYRGRGEFCTDDNQDQVGASIPGVIGNGLENQGPRALIYAYDDDKCAKISSNKPWHTEILDVNILGNRVAPESWKNTEEEEFDWEDMSPTLADGVSKSSLLRSSLPPFRRIQARPPMSTPIQSDTGIQRVRSSQVQILHVDYSSNNVDDALMG